MLHFFFSKRNQDGSVPLFQNYRSKAACSSGNAFKQTKAVLSTSILSANRKVRRVLQLQQMSTRGTYAKLTPEQKAEIGKRAAEHLRISIDGYVLNTKSSLEVWRTINGWGQRSILSPRNVFR